MQRPSIPPSASSAPAAGQEANPTSKQILGIRPNDIKLAKSGDRALAATVHLIEPLGDVTIVSVEANGQTLRIVLPEQQASVYQSGRSSADRYRSSENSRLRGGNG